MDEFPKGDKYILYADDDPDDRYMFDVLLREADHHMKVIVVKDGKEAISFLENLAEGDMLPCLILADANMPLMNGIETLKWIKGHPDYKSVPVIIYSTSSSTQDIEGAQRWGAAEFITKPFKVEALRTLMKKFVNFCDTVPKRPK